MTDRDPRQPDRHSPDDLAPDDLAPDAGAERPPSFADPNPFVPPPTPDARPSRSAGDSIEHEPHFSYQEFREDESERTAGAGLDPLGGPQSYDDEVEHSVWDEPSLSSAISGPMPESATTYAKWLQDGIDEFTASKSALVWLAVVIFAGPWSIVGTFASQMMGQGAKGVLAICIFGPLIEEVMKAAAILWIVEKRPYFFRSRQQIITAAIASGLWFAVLENFLYLNVYIENPSPGIIAWRWSVCVLLHVGCTLLSGIGLSKVWHHTMQRRSRPKMSIASGYLMAAVACHAVYNTAAVLFSVAREYV